MHEEVTIPELTDVVARLAALLGPGEGGVQPLDGGITNRNYRATSAATTTSCACRRDTSLLGIDREAERLATRRAAELASAPRSRRCSRAPPASSPASSRGES